MKRKTVLITGASRGIGKAIALAMAGENYNLIITCKSNTDLLTDVSNEIKNKGCNCYTFKGDLSEFATALRLFDYIHSLNLKVDILINNAGISHIGVIQSLTEDTWNELWNTNVTSVVSLSRLAVSDMLSAGGGSIINISSVWGLVGASCEAAYSATKGAVNSFTLALAKELEFSNISVNAIACGIIDTDMNNHLTKEELEEIILEIPAGRIGTPLDVANEVIKLINDNLSGQIIKLDGGWIDL